MMCLPQVSEDKELPGGHFLSISGGGGGGGAVNSSSTAASSNIAAAAFGRRHSAERQREFGYLGLCLCRVGNTPHPELQ